MLNNINIKLLKKAFPHLDDRSRRPINLILKINELNECLNEVSRGNGLESCSDNVSTINTEALLKDIQPECPNPWRDMIDLFLNFTKTKDFYNTYKTVNNITDISSLFNNVSKDSSVINNLFNINKNSTLEQMKTSLSPEQLERINELSQILNAQPQSDTIPDHPTNFYNNINSDINTLNSNNNNNSGSSLIQAGASIANNIITNAWASHHRKKNYEYNEMAARQADMRQRQQYWDLYSPKALMGQYAAAGLSPSLMMSGGAPAVGQSSAQGNQSSGIQGPYPSTSAIDPVAAAQIANIWADTEKKKAETLNISADTEFTLTNIIKASEETENLKQTRLLLEMQTLGQQLQNESQKLENEITSENKDEIIKQCQITSEKLQRESDRVYKMNEKLDLENQLSRETFTTRVKQFTADYEKTIMLTAKAASDIELNEQQIQSLIENIAISRYESRTKRISALEQIRMDDETVKQWAKQNGFTEEMIKNEKWNIATKTITNIIDSGCKVAAAVISK